MADSDGKIPVASLTVVAGGLQKRTRGIDEESRHRRWDGEYLCALASRLGVAVPKTVLLPHEQHPPGTADRSQTGDLCMTLPAAVDFFDWVVQAAADLTSETALAPRAKIVVSGVEGESDYRTIEELQSQLDPDTFWRVHRSEGRRLRSLLML